jgi:hypothetical protein
LRRETALLALPVVLTMMAAWFHAFPYHSRVILFTTAPLALLGGEGAASFFRRGRAVLAADAAPMKRIFWAASSALLIILLLLPVGLAAWRVVSPWRREMFPWPERAAAKQVALPELAER